MLMTHFHSQEKFGEKNIAENELKTMNKGSKMESDTKFELNTILHIFSQKIDVYRSRLS